MDGLHQRMAVRPHPWWMTLLRICRKDEHALLLVSLAVFVYACGAMAVFQTVILPIIGTDVTDGLIGGDPQYYHQLAMELAEQVRQEGWSAWRLRPDGQGVAGILAALYVVTWSHPLLTIPLNALLHAVAAVTLIAIVRNIVPLRYAVLASLLYVVSPYQMHWFSQVNKDVYVAAGAFLMIFGWVDLTKQLRRATIAPASYAMLAVIAGAALISVVRPYLLEMLQVANYAMAGFIAAVALYRGIDRRATWHWPVVLRGTVVLLIPFLLNPMTEGGASGATIRSHQSHYGADEPALVSTIGRSSINPDWLKQAETKTGIALAIDKKAFAIIRQRDLFDSVALADNETAREMFIDNEHEFSSIYDVLRYLPRALQIGLLSPFPRDWWIAKPDSDSMFRKFVEVEMVLGYIGFLSLAVGIFVHRLRPEIVVPVMYVAIVAMAYGLAVPHVGIIYRYRYGFFMLLVTIGLAVLARLLRIWRNASRRRLVLSQ